MLTGARRSWASKAPAPRRFELILTNKTNVRLSMLPSSFMKGGKSRYASHAINKRLLADFVCLVHVGTRDKQIGKQNVINRYCSDLPFDNADVVF